MPKFRKRPVEIEAELFDGEPDNLPLGFIKKGDPIKFEWWNGGSDHMVAAITTLEGVMICHPGEWIIRGVQGELYPCKPDIFDATYDPL